MSTVTVRDVVIGEGIPKICVPITGTTRDSIIGQAHAIMSMPADIVEWRADYYESMSDNDAVISIIRDLRGILGDIPLLMTIRTSSEGGMAEISHDKYANVNLSAAGSGMVDMIDVEAFSYVDSERLIRDIKAAGARVIASYHDFSGTPPRDEIIRRLIRMQDLGADIAKVAVMPESIRDVTALLAATCEMKASHTKTPVVTISMSDAGIVSRLTGEIYGSAITFGAGSEASAPGQIPAADLRELLHLIHTAV